MPELPEVETMRRGILDAVGGRVEEVVRMPCPRKALTIEPRLDVIQRRTAGKYVRAVERLGKRVVVRLGDEPPSDTTSTADDDALIFEPRMTGLVLVSDPPSVEHLRIELRLSGSRLTKIWYWDQRGLGHVLLLTAGELNKRLLAGQLGPDALSIGADELRERVGAYRRPIKVALLDQRLVAGIGNLYAAEILHVARIHPERPCDQLKPAEWKKLHAAMLAVLEEAVRYEGSTLSDGTYRNVLNSAGGYQNHHRVYDREGQRCPTCRKDDVVRIVQAQRSTFFCPSCQRAAGSS